MGKVQAQSYYTGVERRIQRGIGVWIALENHTSYKNKHYGPLETLNPPKILISHRIGN